MEGVGARLGRSSTRYGPTTVFSGPVRKWKKKWVHVSPSPAAASTNKHSHINNGNANGNNDSRVLLYKWTPIPQSSNANSNGNGEDVNGSAPEDPPRVRCRYVPIAVLEVLKDEAAEKINDEAEPSGFGPGEGEPTSVSNTDRKPDISDTTMEDGKAPRSVQVPQQDLNESTLDLNYGVKAHDGDHDS